MRHARVNQGDRAGPASPPPRAAAGAHHRPGSAQGVDDRGPDRPSWGAHPGLPATAQSFMTGQ